MIFATGNKHADKIGPSINFCGNERLGSGRFGPVFFGRFTDISQNLDVAIKRMRSDKMQVDSSLYVKANGKQNIIKYYGTHCSLDEFT